MCLKRSPRSHSPNVSNSLKLEQLSTAKILGVTFRQDLKWNDHIANVTAKAFIFVKGIKENWSQL